MSDRLLGGGVFALVTLAWCSLAGAQIVERPIPGDPISIDSGKVTGKLLDTGVRGYFGIPYAAAPVGALRWREPQPVRPWRGTYNADRFAPECIQILRPHNINHYFGEEASSEDCLYLNLWVPASATPDARLPVVVWIHGGGLSIGSPGMANYSGENLATKGVVYVSLGYRLGAFGFMAHPQLTQESPFHASGNYGFLDQVAALQWIQRNIERFGGDPTRITVMGQSAGASSAFSLQVSPMAKGLFHRVVGMSGGGIRSGGDLPTQAEAEISGIELQKALGVNSLEALRDLPADRILAAQAEFQLGGTAGTVRFRPNQDARFMPKQPREVFARGEQNDVPLLLGFTRDESSNDLRTAKDLTQFRQAAEKYFGERRDEFLRLYPATAENVSVVGAQATRDGGMATSMRSWAHAQIARGRQPVFLYMFARGHSYAANVVLADIDPDSAGAYHSSEIPFFLLTLDAYNKLRITRAWNEEDRALAATMSSILVEFASSGVPRAPSVQIPRFDGRRESLLVLDYRPQVSAFNRPRMEFFSKVNMPGVVGAPRRTPRD